MTLPATQFYSLPSGRPGNTPKPRLSTGPLWPWAPQVASPGLISPPPDNQDGRYRLHHSLSPPPRLRQARSPAPLPTPSSPAAAFLSAFSSPRSSTGPAPRSPPPEDSEGNVIGGYSLGPQIGHGGFSIVRRATAIAGSGDPVAVKVVRRSAIATTPGVRARLEHEAKVWASLRHEHILPLFATHETPHASYFFMLLCPAGSLWDILKRDGRPGLPRDDVGTMFRQIVRGLLYLHDVAGIVHGDMKLENVLIDDAGGCRIADFGLAKKIGVADSEDDDDDEDDVMGQMVGPSSHAAGHVLRRNTHAGGNMTRPRNVSAYAGSRMTPPPQPAHAKHRFLPGSLPYAAPELLTPQPPPTNPSDPLPPLHNPAQDIWAIGCILFALLTGRLPFTDPFEPRLQMKIVRGQWAVPPSARLSKEDVGMLRGCLEVRVAERWDVRKVDGEAWGVGWGEGVEWVGECAGAQAAVGGDVDGVCERPTRGRKGAGAGSSSGVSSTAAGAGASSGAADFSGSGGVYVNTNSNTMSISHPNSRDASAERSRSRPRLPRRDASISRIAAREDDGNGHDRRSRNTSRSRNDATRSRNASKSRTAPAQLPHHPYLHVAQEREHDAHVRQQPQPLSLSQQLSQDYSQSYVQQQEQPVHRPAYMQHRHSRSDSATTGSGSGNGSGSSGRTYLKTQQHPFLQTNFTPEYDARITESPLPTINQSRRGSRNVSRSVSRSATRDSSPCAPAHLPRFFQTQDRAGPQVQTTNMSVGVMSPSPAVRGRGRTSPFEAHLLDVNTVSVSASSASSSPFDSQSQSQSSSQAQSQTHIAVYGEDDLLSLSRSRSVYSYPEDADRRREGRKGSPSTSPDPRTPVDGEPPVFEFGLGAREGGGGGGKMDVDTDLDLDLGLDGGGVYLSGGRNRSRGRRRTGGAGTRASSSSSDSASGLHVAGDATPPAHLEIVDELGVGVGDLSDVPEGDVVIRREGGVRALWGVGEFGKGVRVVGEDEEGGAGWGVGMKEWGGRGRARARRGESVPRDLDDEDEDDGEGGGGRWEKSRSRSAGGGPRRGSSELVQQLGTAFTVSGGEKRGRW